MVPRFMAAGSWPRNAYNRALQAFMQATRVKNVLKRAAILAGALPLPAAPVWRAPAQIPLGEIVVIELRENDPTLPALPRPGEDKLGSLAIRSISPTENNRGWRLTVQALAPGLAVIPPIDLGGGRISPELKIQVVRTVPYGAPWMGFGGSSLDAPPRFRFPWGQDGAYHSRRQGRARHPPCPKARTKRLLAHPGIHSGFNAKDTKRPGLARFAWTLDGQRPRPSPLAPQ